ncbi:MAG: ATP-binding cassette domain-containing protein [Anaerovoracaceae bacterium]
METAIKVENLYKSFGKNVVLNDINLEVRKGEFLCLLGPSGCGKSTLLRQIAGLDKTTSGKIFLHGEDATNFPVTKRNFGIVFQSYALFPNLTAADNIAYGLKNKKISIQLINETVDRLLNIINLSDARDRYPSQLSGGEQQRVALARALAVNPDFLLLDEPLSALDAKVRGKLRKQICQIQREFGLTTIMVTHDQEEALTMADRIVVMNKKKIVQVDTPEGIYNNPKSEFVADFIGSINFIKDLNGTSAIRPEDILLSKEDQQGYRHGKVTDMEFRGPIYRLTLRSDRIGKESEYILDIPQKEKSKQGIELGHDIYFSFPNNKLHQFGKSVV